jgi:hypothetical protein
MTLFGICWIGDPDFPLAVSTDENALESKLLSVVINQVMAGADKDDFEIIPLETLRVYRLHVPIDLDLGIDTEQMSTIIELEETNERAN